MWLLFVLVSNFIAIRLQKKKPLLGKNSGKLYLNNHIQQCNLVATKFYHTVAFWHETILNHLSLRLENNLWTGFRVVRRDIVRYGSLGIALSCLAFTISNWKVELNRVECLKGYCVEFMHGNLQVISMEKMTF